MFEKHSSVSCVFATNSLSTKSSSFIAVADRPRPPRPWLVLAHRCDLHSTVRERDDHVLGSDQSSIVSRTRRRRCAFGARRRTARGCRAAPDGSLRAAARDDEDVAQVADELEQLTVLGEDLVLLESGEAVQPQVEDAWAWARTAVPPSCRPNSPVSPSGASGWRPHARASAARRPSSTCAPSAPPSPRRCRRGLDQRDHLIDLASAIASPPGCAPLARLARSNTCGGHDSRRCRRKAR